MSAVLEPARAARAPRTAPQRLALLGTGTVGVAFIDRYQRLRARGVALPPVLWLANSRTVQSCGDGVDAALDAARNAPRRISETPGWAEAEALRAGDIVVDATASDSVADWHLEWAERAVHVVTANKLGNGGALARAQAIDAATARTGSGYGDAATVGAGLPLLRSVRALVAGGDRIHRVEGVLSGSLAWLFDRFDGSRPFSALVREACAAGYAEPDPRVDLSGEDVRRKLLILARAAGLPLQADDVQVDSLVPPELAALPAAAVDTALARLDAPLQARLQDAVAQGGRLRFVGSFDALGARVGLQVLAPGHALLGGAGTDNRVAIYSDRYDRQPLLVQGPGAGAEVTAAALLDDVLALARA